MGTDEFDGRLGEAALPLPRVGITGGLGAAGLRPSERLVAADESFDFIEARFTCPACDCEGGFEDWFYIAASAINNQPSTLSYSLVVSMTKPASA